MEQGAPQSEQLEQLVERVERLLLRHEELQRTHALVLDQVEALKHERDSLKTRLQAARTRVDTLLKRLPVDEPSLNLGQSLGSKAIADL
jgi:predicted nuclease with TOPRIM domain